ncbi:MAG TPA: ATP-grasp domain-containing protein [Legionella sp.]|nr:ATP-grasp domain-containing protein [Legionella sp.]
MLNCVIVDAYGPGMFFLPLFNEKKLNVIHIQSSKDIPPPFLPAIEKASFIERIVYKNDIDAVVNSLKKYAPIAFIIPGFETGVQLADTLSEILELKTNGTALSSARRNKYEMMEALRSNNIPAVNYFKTAELNKGIEWVNSEANYPVVLKPVDSASSEDVYISNNEEELKQAFNKILNKTNIMGLENTVVLLQSYLEGTEYVVNSVSCNGMHYVTDIWVCKKRIVNNRVIYDKEELIPAEGVIQEVLSLYIFKVLDALKIKYGPAHSEVILTKNGPILLETGARVGGAVHPDIHKDCFGHSQIELTLDAYLNEQNFREKTHLPYIISKYIYVVMVISEQEGVIKEISLINKLQNLSTVYFTRFKKKIGDKLQKTIDLSSSPATIYLVCENKDTLENEYQALLTLCKNGFSLELTQ